MYIYVAIFYSLKNRIGCGLEHDKRVLMFCDPGCGCIVQKLHAEVH